MLMDRTVPSRAPTAHDGTTGATRLRSRSVAQPIPAPDCVLVAGATGLIGRELLRLLSARPAVEIHLLLRRPLTEPPPTMVVPHVVDFRTLPPMPPASEAYCALGTTIRAAGSQQAFRAVDLDAVVAVARAAHRAGTRRLAVVSSLGASPHARGFYSRVKGEMEAALSAIGFEQLVIARPSLLVGDRRTIGQPDRPGERLALALARPIAGLLPAGLRPIKAENVARAMLAAMTTDRRPGLRVLDSAELQRLGRA